MIEPFGRINAHHRLDAKEEYELYVRGCRAGAYPGTPAEPVSFEQFLARFPKACRHCTGWIRDGDRHWFLGISAPKPEDHAVWLAKLAELEAANV